MRCQRCDHEICGEVPRCLYCGRSPDARLQEISEAGRVQAGTYRSGGTLWPFVIFSLILGAMGAVLALVALQPERNLTLLGGA